MGHLKRYRQIATALVRHGLNYMVGVFGLERFVPFHRGMFSQGREDARQTPAEHVRLALEDLGVTFVKLGQILSTRPDLLPPEYLQELARLQDAATPIPGEEAEAVVAEELGMPVGESFAVFERIPLAAASIGQAHAAKLLNGDEVVVKVRRPGVVPQVTEDIEIFRNLATVASRRWPPAEQYDLVGLADEFAETLRGELDYLREGRNAERFAANFAGDPDVHIPKVYWEQSTASVLTLERIRGIKVDDIAALDAAGIDRKQLAHRIAAMLLKMILEDGFFHADPHPGNFFVEPNGCLGVVDFGMVGVLDEAGRERLAILLGALTSGDADRLVDAVIDVSTGRGQIDREGLRRDIQRLLARYYELPLGKIPLGRMLEEALAAVRRHRLQLPSGLALLFRALIVSEGLGLRLDPEFNLSPVLRPFAERLLMRRYSPMRWARRMGRAMLDADHLLSELPRRLHRALKMLDRGGFEFGVRQESLEPLADRLERLANRIVLGVITAAFIVALAVLMLVYHPGEGGVWMGRIFAGALVVAAGLGLYLAWRIIRTGRG